MSITLMYSELASAKKFGFNLKAFCVTPMNYI